MNPEVRTRRSDGQRKKKEPERAPQGHVGAVQHHDQTEGQGHGRLAMSAWKGQPARTGDGVNEAGSRATDQNLKELVHSGGAPPSQRKKGTAAAIPPREKRNKGDADGNHDVVPTEVGERNDERGHAFRTSSFESKENAGFAEMGSRIEDHRHGDARSAQRKRCQ